MLVLLRETIEKVGKAGETVKVKDGFARNYLIPKQLAYPATNAYMNVIKEELKAETRKVAKLKADAEALKAKLDNQVFTISANAGEEDKLFGSITSQNIVDAVTQAGIELDKRKVVLDESIRTIGEHSVKYKLHAEVSIEFKINVVKA